MEITIKNRLDKKVSLLVLGLFAEDKKLYSHLSRELSAELKEAIENKRFDLAKFGRKYFAVVKSLPYKKLLIISLGSEKDFSQETLRRAFCQAVRGAKKEKADYFTTNLAELAAKKMSPQKIGRSAAEGLLLADYAFDKYLSKERQAENVPIKEVVLQWTKKSEDIQRGLRIGQVLASSTNYVKDLVNEPAAVVTPEYLEQEAKKLVSGKVKLKVLNKEEMKQLGMNALLAVSSGSANSPKLLILEYNGGGKGKFALVGKGITFDSGGLHLKPINYIEDMKSDMAGAAAVLATVKTLSLLEVKVNVIGVIAACDNLVDAKSMKPGDIVAAYNKKTIEIKNTDAEGRLILADALSYVEDKYHPETIVDIATLTGAAIVALGKQISAILANDKKLVSSLVKAGEESYDRVWELPFISEYDDSMDGEISDLVNIPLKMKGGEAGTITAGVFLRQFIDQAKWAHIDIGGTAFVNDPLHYQQKGATGAGARLLSSWLMGESV